MAAVTVTVTDDGIANGRVVRLAPETADQLGVGSGGTIGVTGTDGRRTAAGAVLDPDLDLDQVAMDETTAGNASATVGDAVTLEAVFPTAADRVTLVPIPELSIKGGETAVRDSLLETPLVTGDQVSVALFNGALDVPLRVRRTSPDGPVTVTDGTTIDLEKGPAETVDSAHRVPHVPDEVVGGYDEVRKSLERTIVRPLTDERRYTSAGGQPGGGVLLTGPSGVGKTHLLGHAGWKADATLVTADSTRLLTDSRSDLNSHLEDLTEAARRASPAIVHLDGLDQLGDGNRPDRQAIQIARATDRLVDQSGIVVVGEAQDEESVPEELRRGDRLSRTIEVTPPDRSDRAAILETLTRSFNLGADVDLRDVGRRAFGYVAADLAGLRSYALEEAVERASDGNPVVTAEAFEAALTQTEPGALRGVAVETPDVSYDDIGGLDDAKRELTRAVEWPLRYPGAFEQLGLDAPTGVLLFGPPGTGKTMLARAVAATTDANFLPVDGPELMNKYVGESERAVRELFERARANAPTVVFFDEIDSMAPSRATDAEASAPERVVSQLLTELDGIRPRERVTVIAATNRPDRLDNALLRPGRLDRLVHVPLPDAEARREIFRVHVRDRPVDGLDFDELAARTDGYTGSDIAAVVREASLLALESYLESAAASAEPGANLDVDPATVDGDGPRVSYEDVARALEGVGPSVSEEAREYYADLGDEFSQSGDRSR